MKVNTSNPARGPRALKALGFAAPLLSLSAMAAPPVIEDMGIVNTDVIEFITDMDVEIPIKASNNPTSYSASGLPSGLSVDSETGIIEGEVTSETFTTATLFATNADGTGSRVVSFEIFERMPDLPPPADSSTYENLEDGIDVNGTDMAPFTQSPSNPLFEYQGDIVFQSYFYRQSGIGNRGEALRNRLNPPHYSEQGIRTYVRGPATITFDWWTNIESGYDFFSFYVNQDPVPPSNPGSTLQNAGRGDVYLTGVTAVPRTYTTTLGPGLHRLEWIYSKDYNDAAGGDDRCFVDNLRIEGYPEWVEDKGLNPFNSDFAIDKEEDGNNLLTEYALDLNPKNAETVTPLMTFEPDGRAVLSVEYDDNAYGVTVDIEKSTLLSPGSWSTGLESLSDSGSFLRRREFTPQTDAYYRVKVSSP